MGRNIRASTCASTSARHDEELKCGVKLCQLELNLFFLELSLTELKFNNHFSIFSVDCISI